MRGLLTACALLVLAACGGVNIPPDTPPEPSTSAPVARVAASTFPTVPGFEYRPMPADDWAAAWEVYSHDFDGALTTGEGRMVYNDAGEFVCLMVVLTPDVNNASREAMEAELKQQTMQAGGTYGVAAGDDLAGHEVLEFTDNYGQPNFYWISGSEYVVLTTNGTSSADDFVAQISLRTI